MPHARRVSSNHEISITPLYSPLNLRGDERGLRLRLRSLFGLGVKGYVNFLRPAFAEEATRRQVNDVTE